MAFKLAEAFVRLFTDDRDLKAGFLKAEKETTTVTAKIGSAWKSIAKIAFPAGIVAGAVAAGRATINLADDMGKAAQRAGVAVEEFSKWSYAAELADVSAQQLGDSFKFIARNATMAVRGNELLRQSFRSIGLEVDDLRRMTPDQILKAIADGLQGIENANVRGDVAMRLLGESGNKLITLLGDVAGDGFAKTAAEAERLGRVIDQDTATAAAKFNDDLLRLKYTISAGALPGLQALIPALSSLQTEGLEKTSNKMTAFLHPLNLVAEAIRGTRALIVLFTAAIKVLAADVGVSLDFMIAAAARALQAKAELDEAYRNEGILGKGGLVNVSRDVVARMKADIDAAAKLAKETREEINREIATDAGKKLAALFPDQAKAAVAAKPAMDDLIETSDEAAKKAADLARQIAMTTTELELQVAAARGDTEEVKRLSSALRALQREQMIAGGFTAEQAEYLLDLQGELDSATKLAKGMEEVTSQLGQSLKEMAEKAPTSLNFIGTTKLEVVNEWDEMLRTLEQRYGVHGVYMGALAEQTAFGMSAALGDGFFAIVTGRLDELDDIFKDFLQSLLRQILHFMAMEAVVTFLKFLGNRTGNPFFGDLASALDPSRKFANGGIAPGGFRAFASGGIVSQPTLGLVGEGRFNEAVIPLPDGKSVPVDLRGSGPSEIVMPVTINFDLLGVAGAIRPLVQPTENELVVAIGQNVRRGGALKDTIRMAVRT